MRLIKNSMEFIPQSEVIRVPLNTRGIYVLYRQTRHGPGYEVVYIGMARGARAGIRGRLNSHKKHKGKQWTHFSAFEVWDNIAEQEVQELEGIFRHVYRMDPQANRLNKQRALRPLNQVRGASAAKWRE